MKANSDDKTAGLKDGTYTGEGMGNNGTIAVEVTIENENITNIVFTKFVDDLEYFDSEIDGKEMISRVLEAVDKALESARQ